MRERFLEPAFHLSNVEVNVSGVTHAEVMHKNRRPAFRLHLVVELFKYLDTHVFKHRQT